MLGFLRKYQRFFFLITTIVIVISFSFFGTSPNAPDQQVQIMDETAFELRDGSELSRYEVDAMARFLSTDSLDAWIFGGAAGFNFLNDGFVRRDIMASGIGEILVQDHLDVIASDLNQRLRSEKAFVPYVHPAVKFLGVEQIWQQVAPALFEAYTELRGLENAATPEAFKTRVQLYLAESALPQPLLKRFLVQQQQQYDWIPEDPYLDQRDLSLFGYHRVDDWFGQNFGHLVAQLTCRVAEEAESRGYRVSDDEVYADLMRNASLSFQQISSGSTVAADQIAQAYTRQLRVLGITESQAVRIWRRVMLFRRLVDDVGHVPLVDAQLVDGFQKFASTAVDVERFELPADLRINSFRKLQELETYLAEVADTNQNSLVLPNKFRSTSQVSPQFLQKRFVVMLRETSTQSLQAKVNVRDAWKWQLVDENWEQVKAEFPELRDSTAAGDDARFAELEALDPVVRARIDRFARESIVAMHPEWIDEALADPDAERYELRLLKQGGQPPLAGIDDSEAFALVLQKAIDGDESAISQLTRYTQDDEHVYRIHVVDGSPDWEIMTFAEAVRNDAVSSLLDRHLQRHYNRIRDRDPSKYQDANGQWKELKEVSDMVAEDLFAVNIRQIKRAEKDELGDEPDLDDIAAVRLLAHLRHARETLAEGADPETWVAKDVDAKQDNPLELSERAPLANQWKLTQREVLVRRDQGKEIEALLAVKEGDFSNARSLGGGAAAFDRVTGTESSSSASFDSVRRAHELLGRQVVKGYMGDLLPKLGGFQTAYLERKTT